MTGSISGMSGCIDVRQSVGRLFPLLLSQPGIERDIRRVRGREGKLAASVPSNCQQPIQTPATVLCMYRTAVCVCTPGSSTISSHPQGRLLCMYAAAEQVASITLLLFSSNRAEKISTSCFGPTMFGICVFECNCSARDYYYLQGVFANQPPVEKKSYKEIDVHIVHLNGQQATIKPPYTGLTSVYAFQLLAYGIWPKSTLQVTQYPLRLVLQYCE